MSYLDTYRNKRVLITGGTGSIGSELVWQLSGIAEVTVFSRDETKQYELRNREFPNVRFVIGDVRRKESVAEAVYGQDFVFHVAAMKYVELCESNVAEAVATNVIGTQNIRDACHAEGVEALVLISTDKAADPAGVMGMTKYLAERIVLAGSPKINRSAVVRFGNVLGSRGSVVWKFKKDAEDDRALKITDKRMIRFVMSKKSAVELVLWAGARADDGTITIRKMPVVSVYDLAKVFSDDVVEIGLRPGEKIEETLIHPGEERYLQFFSTSIGHIGTIDPRVSVSQEFDPVSFYDFRLDADGIRELLKESGVI